ncbi:MAG: alpha/beta hydrolase [Pseudolabrys sp.]|nr:alpha/beta hydrolase [Pseudolabrys sp.]
MPASGVTGRTPFRRTAGRIAGIGMLSLLPLALLVSLVPNRQPNSQTGDAFAARWPTAEGLLRSVTADSRGDRNTVAAIAPIPSNAAPAALSAGLIRPGPEWNAYALAAPRLPAGDTTARFQLAAIPRDTRVPTPPPRPPAGSLAQAKTELIAFATAPFPYDGVRPGTDRPFLDVVNGNQKGHRTARGSVLWQDKTFSDNRVLLHIPGGFSIDKPAVMVVYFHGHRANLSRDVLQRQKLPEQISLSGMNAVLVAPQFAVDAANSSPGRFGEPGGFARFIDEAGRKLAAIHGKPAAAKQFAAMPVILVAYSGGYLPASWSLRHGGAGARLRGVVLLDALYGELGSFAQWIKKTPSAVFISAYTGSTRRQHRELAQMLEADNVRYTTELGNNLWRGRVALLATDGEVNHQDFVTQAWTANPVADVLAKLN